MKKKPGSTHIYWNDTTYKVGIVFLIGDKDECARIAKKKYHLIIDMGCEHLTHTGMCWWLPEFGNVIWLKKFSKSKDDIGYLVHECQHALFNVFNARGIKYSVKGEEAFCYYIEDLVNFFLERWEKNNERKAKATRK